MRQSLACAVRMIAISVIQRISLVENIERQNGLRITLIVSVAESVAAMRA